MSWSDSRLAQWLSGGRPVEPEGDPARIREVQAVLDELRPALALDGGDVQLLAVSEDGVRLRLSGACTSCGSQADTLRHALEPRLRERLPWLVHVEQA